MFKFIYDQSKDSKEVVFDAQIIEEITRGNLIEKIALIAVWSAIRAAHYFKINRCDLCNYAKTLKYGETCPGDQECLKNGFTESESINSAVELIKKALSGRI